MSLKKSLGICRACLQLKRLIEAHIVPRSFFDKSTVLLQKNKYPERRPTGTYDQNILCVDCDKNLGANYDEYAKQILLDRIGISHEIWYDYAGRNPIGFYKLKNKSGYDRLTRFFISVLWRASISKHKDVASLSLGPYEELAKRLIFESGSINNSCFQVVICHFPNVKKPIHIFSPKLARIERINFYILTMGFFKVFIKVDKRRIPEGLNASFLSSNNDFLMVEADLQTMPEYPFIIEMAKRHPHRNARE